MRKPENIHLLRSHRLTKSGGFALAFYCALNFSSLGAAVIKLPLSATKTAASSTDLVANTSIQSPVGNHQGAVLAKATPTAQSLTPIPEISVLFPIIGLVIAIALTQLLRRRRISQRSGSPNGR
jgi:phosphate/sulfate permease